MILETAIGAILAATTMTAVAEPEVTRAERFRILWALSDPEGAFRALLDGMDSRQILDVLYRLDGNEDGEPAMLGAFARGYAEAALWSTNDESTPSGGDPMDKNYDIGDIAPETWVRLIMDCLRFRTENEVAIRAVLESGTDRGEDGLGRDFWLTRNGHGVGFSDRDYAEPWKGKLDEAARKFREFGLYVGDDGQVWH